LLPASVRKNLAVHVSLSSFLHNVKELTFTPQGPNVGEATASHFYQQNKPAFRLPGSQPALSDCANQWEQLKSFASSASRFLVKFFFTVNRFFQNFSITEFPRVA